jgi:hypothetical protein
MSRHKNHLNRLEKQAKPDTYRKRYFIPWERREPLTASEWVELNDLHEKAHQKFEAHLKREEGRLLTQREIDRLYKEYEETGDFEAVWAVIGEPTNHLDDSECWGFLEVSEQQRAGELLERHLKHNMLNDPKWGHLVEPVN